MKRGGNREKGRQTRKKREERKEGETLAPGDLDVSHPQVGTVL